MNRPTLVLFDLDEVLVGYDHGARVAHLAQATGTSAEAVHAALYISGFERDADRGLFDGPQTLAEFSRRLGAPVALQHWIDARRAAMQPRPDVLALAHAAARQARVAILTNNGLLLREHLAQMHPPLFPLFSGRVFCSAQFRLSKPDPAIFRACLAALEVAPADALFIDDKADNAKGARKAGLQAHHYTGIDGLRAALREHGIEEPAA